MKRRAASYQTPSGRLGELVNREFPDAWPDDFFRDVAGGWVGEKLERPPQPDVEAREPLH